MSQKVSERMEQLGIIPEIPEQDEQPERFQISLGDILMFIPIINIIFVLVGCIFSEKIIAMTIKQITGEDTNDDKTSKRK